MREQQQLIAASSITALLCSACYLSLLYYRQDYILVTVPGDILTCDIPPALSTASVTDRAQQMTWILKKAPRKLLQPRANISCTRTYVRYLQKGIKFTVWTHINMQLFYLVGIHIIAVLGCQRPAHSQVDDIPHNSQGESCAQHVFPLTDCWQDWCWEPRN